MMIGTGPYDSQVGGALPTMYSYSPGVPPEKFVLLKNTSQACASVQDGIMYAINASWLTTFRPGISVRTTSHASDPPMTRASRVAPADTVKECPKGVCK